MTSLLFRWLRSSSLTSLLFQWLRCSSEDFMMCSRITSQDGDCHVLFTNFVYFLQLQMVKTVWYSFAEGESLVRHYNYVYFLQLKMATPMCDIIIMFTFRTEDGDSHVLCTNYVSFLQLQMVTTVCDILICILFADFAALPMTSQDGDCHVLCTNFVYFWQLQMVTTVCDILLKRATPGCDIIIMFIFYSWRWQLPCVTL